MTQALFSAGRSEKVVSSTPARGESLSKLLSWRLSGAVRRGASHEVEHERLEEARLVRDGVLARMHQLLL